MIKAKSKNVLEASYYVCRSYREKSGRVGEWGLFAPPILNKVKLRYVTYLIIGNYEYNED